MLPQQQIHPYRSHIYIPLHKSLRGYRPRSPFYTICWYTSFGCVHVYLFFFPFEFILCVPVWPFCHAIPHHIAGLFCLPHFPSMFLSFFLLFLFYSVFGRRFYFWKSKFVKHFLKEIPNRGVKINGSRIRRATNYASFFAAKGR